MEITTEQLQDGTMRITVTGRLPQATVAENPKYLWTPWQRGYQRQQFDKDGLSILQSLANLRHVEGVLASRNAARAEKAAAKASAKAPAELVAAAAQSQQPTQTEVAEVSAPTSAPTTKAKKSRKGRS